MAAHGFLAAADARRATRHRLLAVIAPGAHGLHGFPAAHGLAGAHGLRRPAQGACARASLAADVLNRATVPIPAPETNKTGMTAEASTFAFLGRRLVTVSSIDPQSFNSETAVTSKILGRDPDVTAQTTNNALQLSVVPNVAIGSHKSVTKRNTSKCEPPI